METSLKTWIRWQRDDLAVPSSSGLSGSDNLHTEMSFRAICQESCLIFFTSIFIFPSRFWISLYTACTSILLCDHTRFVEKSAIIHTDNPDTTLTTNWLMPLAIRSTIRIVATLMHMLGNKLHNLNARVEITLPQIFIVR